MPSLDRPIRNGLERTIKNARDIAEAAAHAALEQLGVGEGAPFRHLTEDERDLRRRLRVHGRQLGDIQNGGGKQETDRLTEEVAYEHWHRMLFARFLAENNLLMYPDPDDPVAVTLEECEDLAPDEGAANGWELAARFAGRMLPQIFRFDSPVFQLTLPPEHQQKLERLVADLPLEVFTASDSLGWVYQFWQAKKKEEVNASEVKIGPRELPAVTQLFTEPYMVCFLLDNSLGAWWAARRLSVEDLKNAKSEEELRQKAAIPGVPLQYLRFVKFPFPSGRGLRGESSSLSGREVRDESPSPSGRGVRGEGEKAPIPHDILQKARELRKNQTDAEQLLWGLLRNHRFANKKFRRQHPIARYILDFYCHELKLAIELDGGQHNENSARKYDEERTRFLNEQGIRVLRFWNNEVLRETQAVLESLWNAVNALTPTPLPKGEGLFRSSLVKGVGGGPLSEGEGLSRSSLMEGVGGGPLSEGEEFIWEVAAGTFDKWPDHLADLKTIDHASGSGHFLVALFLMLVPMRMELEGLSAREAVDAVLRDNIHGLEIDKRCVELAAFALALTAWKYPELPSPQGRGVGGEGATPIGYRVLPDLNLACSGLSVSVGKEEWKQLGLGKKNMTLALDWMHDALKDAPILGSLLNPAKTDAAKIVPWEELAETLDQALKKEQSDEHQEAAIVAHGLARAAILLAARYHLVVTNVPYLARGKQNETLRAFCEKHYPEAKNDLATVFLDRSLELASLPSPLGRGAGGEGISGGTVSVVLPQNWLFLTSYKKFREKLLKNHTWHLIARLGPQAFQTPMWDFNVQLITMSQGNSVGQTGGLFGGAGGGNLIRGVDVSEPRSAGEKADGLLTTEIRSVEQAKQLENPDSVVSLDELSLGSLLGYVGFSQQGITSGDTNRYGRRFWELAVISSNEWSFWQSTSKGGIPFAGRESILFYQSGKGCLSQDSGATLRGSEYFGIPGILLSLMRDIPVTISTGDISDDNTAIIRVKNESHLPLLWAYAQSNEFAENIRQINQKINIAPRVPERIPFDLDHWTKVTAKKYPNGLPKPYSDDPTQWIFHGHPCGSVVWDEEKKWTTQGPLRTDDTVLQVAVARLLGYRWPAELDAGMELADEQREWVKRCEALVPYADKDGIVCIPSVRGEASAADRLLNLLAAAYTPSPPTPLPEGEGSRTTTGAFDETCSRAVAASLQEHPSYDEKPLALWERGWGEGWSNDILAQLLKSADHAGKTLETWLREKFFSQHCKLFQHRPFIWHIWDGLRDGFAALVNYHKLDAKLLETLIYTYLGDWIIRQKRDSAGGVDGAQERLAAAEGLKKKLELILEGEAPYDIFVRWKPLEKQPIGWNPDLNDGVRLNIRPFLTVPAVGKKGAGVLRDKPNINWNKDRGKDVESAPWYHLFKGDRINDHHLTLVEKKQAREKLCENDH